MKIKVSYFCPNCYKTDDRVIKIDTTVPASLELKCSGCHRDMVAVSAQEVKRFIDFLKENKDIDCDLIIGDVDMPASFVWDEDCRITAVGYEKFKPIMDADYKVLTNGNIEIFCDDENLGEEFALSAAGHVGESLYNKWFTGEWC